jgi:hypothetical protein
MQTPLWLPGFSSICQFSYLVVFKKTPLRNGRRPITDPITKMRVAHAFELLI